MFSIHYYTNMNCCSNYISSLLPFPPFTKQNQLKERTKVTYPALMILRYIDQQFFSQGKFYRNKSKLKLQFIPKKEYNIPGKRSWIIKVCLQWILQRFKKNATTTRPTCFTVFSIFSNVCKHEFYIYFTSKSLETIAPERNLRRLLQL